MKDPTQIRQNRTGLMASPELAKEMVAAAEQSLPSSPAEGMTFDEARRSAMQEAEPAGSMPPPAGLGEMAASVLEALQGRNAAVLLDALGARLAFERTGTRIYEALLTKARALGPQEGGPTLNDLSEIWNDELGHFQLLKDAIERLGGDPTVMTPGANLEGVAALGPIQIASDPRLGLRESMRAALLIELADKDSWELLIRLAQSFGQTELAESFEACLATEQQHLTRVRGWVSALTEIAATSEPATPAAEPAELEEAVPPRAA